MFGFEIWFYSIDHDFKQLRVLAVFHQYFEQFIVCEPQSGLNGSPPFVGADDLAIHAFKNLHSLEELWLEPDATAKRTCSSSLELSASKTNNRDSQEDGVDANSDSQTETNVQWVWTRPHDPLVRPIEYVP
jgi:hypothetical protein